MDKCDRTQQWRREGDKKKEEGEKGEKAPASVSRPLYCVMCLCSLLSFTHSLTVVFILRCSINQIGCCCIFTSLLLPMLISNGRPFLSLSLSLSHFDLQKESEETRASWSLPFFASLHISCDLCVHTYTHNVHSSLIQAVFASSLSLEFDFHWWVKWRNQEERAEREAHTRERERGGEQKRGRWS